MVIYCVQKGNNNRTVLLAQVSKKNKHRKEKQICCMKYWRNISGFTYLWENTKLCKVIFYGFWSGIGKSWKGFRKSITDWNQSFWWKAHKINEKTFLSSPIFQIDDGKTIRHKKVFRFNVQEIVNWLVKHLFIAAKSQFKFIANEKTKKISFSPEILCFYFVQSYSCSTKNIRNIASDDFICCINNFHFHFTVETKSNLKFFWMGNLTSENLYCKQ